MPTDVDDIIRKLSPAQRKKVEDRAGQLIAEASTLRKTVEAMGGNLSLIAEFPDRAPVVLSAIAEDDPGIND